MNELADPIRADSDPRVAAEDVDEQRGREVCDSLDRVALGIFLAGAHLEDADGVRRCPQDVVDLGRVRQRMQVRRRGGIACGHRGVERHRRRCLLSSTVGGRCRHSLGTGSAASVDESDCGLERRTRPAVVRAMRFEEREHLLSRGHGKSRHRPELVQGQGEF
ncbi:hypothetical protein P9209_13530 [Prescottella defluvii]|nr:hypothetical protein P9209_13530 [Prescottella defluvii]